MQLAPFAPLYAIADAGVLRERGLVLADYAEALRNSGVSLLQYRDKDGEPQAILRSAAMISEVFAGAGATLMMNDRADLALLAGWSGVHVGQGDLPPADARTVLGSKAIIGVSTHSDEQVLVANGSVADYIAIGPVFATGTKLDAAPAVGLEGVRRARALTTKPLVAIGGITRKNARSVLEAGVDSIAVISGLFVTGESVGSVVKDFLELLR